MVTFLDLLAIKKQLLVQANLRFQILVLQTFKSGSKIRLNTYTRTKAASLGRKRTRSLNSHCAYLHSYS